MLVSMHTFWCTLGAIGRCTVHTAANRSNGGSVHCAHCHHSRLCSCFQLANGPAWLTWLVFLGGKEKMSVKTVWHSYSFSALSYDLPQNAYLSRNGWAEHEYGIRFDLGQTVWPQGVIFLFYGEPHNFFSFTDRLRPNCIRWASTPAWPKAQKIPFQCQRSRSNGTKTPFIRRCIATLFHLLIDCVQIAPESVHRHQLGSRQRKFQVKVKWAKNRFFRGCTTQLFH